MAEHWKAAKKLLRKDAKHEQTWASQSSFCLSLSPTMAKGWAGLVVKNSSSSNYCSFFYGFCRDAYTDYLISTSPARLSKGGSIRHVTLGYIHFIHTSPVRPKCKSQEGVCGEERYKGYINLYLNRPLRVFPFMRRWKRQRTRSSRSVSALCNSVHVDPFQQHRLGRSLLDESDIFLQSSGLVWKGPGRPMTFQF